MDKIAEVADKWGTALTQALSKYGPDAAELAMTIGRLDAIATVLKPLLGALLFGYIALKCKRLITSDFREAKARRGEKFEVFDMNPAIVIPCGFAFALTSIITILCTVDAFNVMALAGIFEPKIWLAAKLLKR